MIPFEDANVEAYRLLLRIEVALREVLRTSLEEAHGRQWRKRLPNDLRKQIREAESEEERRIQFDFMRLGPLYYLTLGDLLKILQQAPASGAVNTIGGKKLVEQLDNVFAPRNALAHSRSISQAGLKCVRAIYAQLENALTFEGLNRVLAKPDAGTRPEDVVPLLIAWLEETSRRMAQLEADCPVDVAYDQANVQYWWDMPEVAGFDHARVEEVADLIRQYNSLPRGIGSVAGRQQFVEQHDASRLISAALQSLRRGP